MEIHITRFADTKATKDSAKRYISLHRANLNIEMFKPSMVVKAHSVRSIKSASNFSFGNISLKLIYKKKKPVGDLQ